MTEVPQCAGGAVHGFGAVVGLAGVRLDLPVPGEPLVGEGRFGGGGEVVGGLWGGDESVIGVGYDEEHWTSFRVGRPCRHPDHRGRTGLHLAGRDLDRNPDIRIRDVELTSQGWHVLRRTTFDYRRRDGRWQTQQRETYDRGNGAVVLPYDTERSRVPLTHVLDGYISPGSVTERLHFFAAPYTPADRTGTGGGLEEEGEDIQVLELPFAQALTMTHDARITDGKTILLLQWAALSGPFARQQNL